MSGVDCCGREEHREGCILCGRPIVYTERAEERECALCHKKFVSNAVCEAGHYVCDACHAAGFPGYAALLLQSPERDPIRLLLEVMALPQVHLHGPEHHAIVPCVLLTAYHNCGGVLDLAEALKTALRRGGQVPGGACGFMGVCGAAEGAGIFASIALKSNPLNAEVWHLPQLLTARCLGRIAEVGGPRCCKRTSRLAVETAAAFSGEFLGVSVTCSLPVCAFSALNRECLHGGCPYYMAG